MKSVIVILLVFLIVSTGCGQSNSGDVQNVDQASNGSVSEEKPANTSTEAEVSTAEEPAVEEEGGKIEVDKGLLSAEITLPASFFENSTEEEVVAGAKEQGVGEVKKNEDGSYTYKMSKSVYRDLLKETKQGVIESITSIENDETFPSIKKIEYNDKLTEFTLTVEREKYEGSFDGMAMLGISMGAMMYQVFEGVKGEDTKATMNLKDEATGETFNTVVYPDQLKQQ